jgi:ubiquitin-protein ligase
MADGIFSSSRSKRKADTNDYNNNTHHQDEEISITEEIKKVRISTTAGLLRAQRDVKEFNDTCASQSGNEKKTVELTICHGQQEIYCQFKTLPLSCPSLFRISIPRFYPHSQPTVYCVHAHDNCSSFIDPATGRCSHTNLEDGWVATMTLMDVVAILEQIALDCGRSSTEASGGLTMSPHRRMCHDGEGMTESNDGSPYPPFPQPPKTYNQMNTYDEGVSTSAMEEEGNERDW